MHLLLPNCERANSLSGQKTRSKPRGLLAISRGRVSGGNALLHSAASSFRSGGGERNRTDDLLLAKQALSQLSYTPDKKLVGLDGFEPSTPALSRRCSNQLSYRPWIQDLGSRIEGRDFSPLRSSIHAP